MPLWHQISNYQTTYIRNISSAFPVKLLLYEYHKNASTSQQCFRDCLGVQAITLTRVDQIVGRPVASLGHNELTEQEQNHIDAWLLKLYDSGNVGFDVLDLEECNMAVMCKK